MDLKSGYPFWAVKNGLMRPFPPLRCDLQCDIAVVGGGITGALIADHLADRGFDVAVVEKRDIGWGSTAASTALIQYEIDTHLTDLAKSYGETEAVLAYKACVTAIAELRELAGRVGGVDFAAQKSLYYASRHRDATSLRDEFELRRKHGFSVDWLDKKAMKARYGLSAPCAILSHIAARLDPYRLTHRLLARHVKRGGQVFDRTVVESIRPSAREVELLTVTGARIQCHHLILAAGYESQHWLRQRVAQNRSSYAFVTDPVDRIGPGLSEQHPDLGVGATVSVSAHHPGRTTARRWRGRSHRHCRTPRSTGRSEGTQTCIEGSAPVPGPARDSCLFLGRNLCRDPVMACPTSDRMPSTVPACISPWPTAATGSPTA